jgi:hypothetical protein
MATRRRKAGRTTWWLAAAAIAVAIFMVWWFSAQRVEAPAPPAIKSADPAIGVPPDDHDAGHEHGEITKEEKESLDRIIQGGGTASPK